MIEQTKQTQSSGDDSTNVQAGKVEIHNHSLSYADVRDIALDVFKNNFEILSVTARETARKRAEEITDEFLKQLQQRNPEGLKRADDPDFQLAIYTAQKEYARSGDKQLGDLLVDLLVDRSKCQSRDLRQIVLTESLEIVPKLTTDQLTALALAFRFKFSRALGFSSTEHVYQMLLRFAAAFSDNASINENCYRHLEFTGCVTITRMFPGYLSQLIRNSYGGAFSSGFTKEEIERELPQIAMLPGILTACFHDSNRLQFSAFYIDAFEKQLVNAGLDADLIKKAKVFWDKHLMSNDEIKTIIISAVPQMQRIYEVWEKSWLHSVNLTSVGMAIAHAYMRTKMPFSANLSIWVN